MTAVERKIVHELLKDDPEVETASEGTEPNRFVVIVRGAPRLTRPAVAIARRSSAGSQAARDAGPDRDPRSGGARRVLLDDALRGLELSQRVDGPIVDVGSGGGTPGIPLAASLPAPRGDPARGRAPQVRVPRARGRDLPNVAVVWGRAEEQPLESFGRRGREGAGTAAGRGGVVPAARSAKAARCCSGSARLPTPPRSPRSRRSSAAARPRRTAGLLVLPQDRADSAGLPAAARHGQEAAARLGSWQGQAARPPRRIAWTRARPHLRAREPEGRRRQDDDRRQPRRLPRRGRRALPRSIDLDPQANATSGLGERANGDSTLRPARRRAAARARQADRVSRTSISSRPSPSSRPRPFSSRRSRAASATSPTRSPARRPTGTRSCSSTARRRSAPLTVNALAAADRVIVPVQAEYYALEGLSQLLGSINLVKARLNPRLAVAGILLTMVDGRTRLAAQVEAGAAATLRRARLHDVRAPLGPPRRGAEPRAARDRLRPPLLRRAGLLEGGDGACRASLSTPPPRSRPRPRGPDRRAPARPSCCTCPVEAVHPNPRQPRRRFEPEATAGLAASIRHQGVLQPVVVRPRAEGGYELIAGERRWRAAREAGCATLPAVVREPTTATHCCSASSRTSRARTSRRSRRRAPTRR